MLRLNYCTPFVFANSSTASQLSVQHHNFQYNITTFSTTSQLSVQHKTGTPTLTNPAVHDVRLPHELQEGGVVHQSTVPLTGRFLQLSELLLQAGDALLDAFSIVVTLSPTAHTSC